MKHITANDLLEFLQNLKMAGNDLEELTVYIFDSEVLLPAYKVDYDGGTVNIY